MQKDTQCFCPLPVHHFSRLARRFMEQRDFRGLRALLSHGIVHPFGFVLTFLVRTVFCGRCEIFHRPFALRHRILRNRGIPKKRGDRHDSFFPMTHRRRPLEKTRPRNRVGKSGIRYAERTIDERRADSLSCLLLRRLGFLIMAMSRLRRLVERFFQIGDFRNRLCLRSNHHAKIRRRIGKNGDDEDELRRTYCGNGHRTKIREAKMEPAFRKRYGFPENVGLIDKSARQPGIRYLAAFVPSRN